MTVPLDVVVHDRTRGGHLITRAFVRRIAALAWPYLRIPSGMTAEVAVTIVGPDRIRTLNRAWRKKDAVTDVLAFPLHTKRIQGYTVNVLGDLFVCPVAVRSKAKAEQRTVRLQTQWTILHGLLHLAGYDHEQGPVRARQMFAIEKRVLKKLQATR